MPTSTRKATTLGALASAAVGLALYLLTLFLELVLAGTARFLLVYPLAVLGRAAFSTVPSPGCSAIAAALFPLVASVGGLILPGAGRRWRRRSGLRRPNVAELETLSLAFALFAPGRSLPRIAVLDDALSLAAVRGTTLIVSRGLLESSSLPAVLAHEQCHLDSMDGRLTEALDRLSVCGDPSRSSSDLKGANRVDGEATRRPGLLYSSVSLVVRLAGGGHGQRGLSPVWSAYWRHREFVADAAAASFGQGPDLARHLQDEVLPFEVSREVGLFNLADHPPTALRIERLDRIGRSGGTK